MEKDAKCKICRRAGKKLFLKGEKCNTPKCPMVTKPYPPGIKGKRRFRRLSEYGKELKEKQKLRNWYNLSEKQFKRYILDVLEKAHRASGEAQDAQEILIKRIESRLDNVIYRLGFADSRIQARQMVSHGHFLVNGKPVNIPSIELKKGDRISVRPSSLKKANFMALAERLKKYEPPVWLRLEPDKLKGTVLGLPSLEIASPPAEIPVIFEFYSR